MSGLKWIFLVYEVEELCFGFLGDIGDVMSFFICFSCFFGLLFVFKLVKKFELIFNDFLIFGDVRGFLFFDRDICFVLVGVDLNIGLFWFFGFG